MATSIILSEIPIDELSVLIEQATTRAIKKHFEDKDAATAATVAEGEEYLRSIKEISEFIGCCDTTSQRLKNTYPAIFHQIGRRFIVRKRDLLDSIKKGKNVIK